MAGRIAENIAHFARVLRAAGLPVGSDRVLAGIAAVELVGIERRDDVHAALSAVMIDRHEQQTVFDAAFAAFWRDPKLLERLMYLMLPRVEGRAGATPPPQRPRRVEEALSPPAPRHTPSAPREADEQRIEAILGFSERERLQHADFESMSASEFALARRLAETVPLPVRPLRTRRLAPSARGRIDLRRALRRLARAPDTIDLPRSSPRLRTPPLVVLIDISGSMDRYARAFLHYAYGLTQRHHRVHTLVFGTRLTDITRCLRHRDPDVAIESADALVQDWKGGTRIASNLALFNRRWARRLLTGNAALLLVTDGLDRDEHGSLSAEAARLKRYAHQLVWLNPLLRYDGFEPRASGVRALLPHVDRMLPVHNLSSLAELADALRTPERASTRGVCGRPIPRPSTELPT
ncbi:MAG: VWA domain-containing protein [Burkholderiaceae bacterium]|nr:VWA domain-containing protein [Burkholderiaceae bacterium]